MLFVYILYKVSLELNPKKMSKYIDKIVKYTHHDEPRPISKNTPGVPGIIQAHETGRLTADDYETQMRARILPPHILANLQLITERYHIDPKTGQYRFLASPSLDMYEDMNDTQMKAIGIVTEMLRMYGTVNVPASAQAGTPWIFKERGERSGTVLDRFVPYLEMLRDFVRASHGPMQERKEPFQSFTHTKMYVYILSYDAVAVMRMDEGDNIFQSIQIMDMYMFIYNYLHVREKQERAHRERYFTIYLYQHWDYHTCLSYFDGFQNPHSGTVDPPVYSVEDLDIEMEP